MRVIVVESLVFVSLQLYRQLHALPASAPEPDCTVQTEFSVDVPDALRNKFRWVAAAPLDPLAPLAPTASKVALYSVKLIELLDADEVVAADFFAVASEVSPPVLMQPENPPSVTINPARNAPTMICVEFDKLFFFFIVS